jgi:hypothetical protein
MCSELNVNELRNFLLSFAVNRGIHVTRTALRKFKKRQLDGARWAVIHGNIPKILRSFSKKPQGCPPSPYKKQGSPLPPDRENHRHSKLRRPKPIFGQGELFPPGLIEKW